MEVRITISDSGSTPPKVEVSDGTGSGQQMTQAGSSTNATEATDAGQAGGGGMSSTAGGDMQSQAPADLLARAAEMGAMNAGPAPDFRTVQQGAPPPFITGNMANLPHGPGMAGLPAAESAGAAPGADARMVTHTAPEGGGSQP